MACSGDGNRGAPDGALKTNRQPHDLADLDSIRQAAVQRAGHRKRISPHDGLKPGFQSSFTTAEIATRREQG